MTIYSRDDQNSYPHVMLHTKGPTFGVVPRTSALYSVLRTDRLVEREVERSQFSNRV